MKNLALTLCYNGSSYHGWQIQQNALTVQEVLLGAVAKVTGEAADIIGCSRTDAGVHALEYVCNFKSKTSIPEEKIPIALNTALPKDIRINRCNIVPDHFHARFSAVSKTYIYKVYTAKIENPFLTDLVYHFPYELNIEHMKKAAEFFIGTYDFSAFMSTGSSQKSTIRTILNLSVSQSGDIVEFSITANSYLYNMVRIIAGTLLYTGIGKIHYNDIPKIIQSGDRRQSGITAGAGGLYLAKVDYGGLL
ncbi:MAG: tRNA pseudouridine(38-40) synthase TruA [Eubacteriales bacterium]|jgi:tRNA pseudouridine38-40 synthase|nr:tRNA pseudouridine(38-40) synthase TruA [Eubacteriales bacterium]